MSFFTAKTTDDSSSGFSFICKGAGEDLSDLESDETAAPQSPGPASSFFTPITRSVEATVHSERAATAGSPTSMDESGGNWSTSHRRHETDLSTAAPAEMVPKPRRLAPAPPQEGRPPLRPAGPRPAGRVAAVGVGRAPQISASGSGFVRPPPALQAQPLRPPRKLPETPHPHSPPTPEESASFPAAAVQGDELVPTQSPRPRPSEQPVPTPCPPPPPIQAAAPVQMQETSQDNLQGIGFQQSGYSAECGGARRPSTAAAGVVAVEVAAGTAGRLAHLEAAIFALEEAMQGARLEFADGALNLAVTQNE
jgi:hypothetical protein